MTPQRKNAGDPRIGDTAARASRRERARVEMDRKLDQALECTFPASDPFQLSNPAPFRASRPKLAPSAKRSPCSSTSRISRMRSTSC